MERQPFLTHCFALVICRNTTTGKFLCIKETRNRGWWVPGGLVEPGEDFFTAAKREVKEEGGIEIELKGVLRVEHSIYGHQTARIRVIFYAESDTETPKQISDQESEMAAWLTVKEIRNLEKIQPGLRGPEIIEWPIYIETGGSIAGINFFTDEMTPVLLNQNLYNNNLLLEINKENDLETFKSAIDDKNLKLLKSILINGYNIDTHINSKNWTALHQAIKSKNEELVKILLLFNADCSRITHKNRNAFHFAMQSSFKILKMLLFQINDKTLEEQRYIINYSDNYGDLPIHILAKDLVKYKSKDLGLFEYLINLGADANTKNNEGYTAYDYINKNYN